VKGIEAAAAGVLAADPELKTSRNGTAYSSFSIAVEMVVDNETGKPVIQWIRAVVFGENAERIAKTAKKGDKLYIEGSLTLTQWNDAHGEVRHGLNLAAWKAMKIGASAIGKKREKRRVEPEQR
jgi:single-strand DNA-binding protein